MPVDPPQVAAAQRHAVAIEEFQNLDRDLAAVVDAIAELRRRELAVFGRSSKIDDDVDHLGDGAAQEEMIVRHLIDPAKAAQELEQPANVSLMQGGHAGE